jgi:hypothetical protein
MTNKELAWCALAHDIYARNLPIRWRDRLFEARGRFIASGLVPTNAEWAECVGNVIFAVNQELKHRERDEHQRKEQLARIADQLRIEREQRAARRAKRVLYQAKFKIAYSDVLRKRTLRRRAQPPCDALFDFYPSHDYMDQFEIGHDTDHLLEHDTIGVYLMAGMEHGYLSELR